MADTTNETGVEEKSIDENEKAQAALEEALYMNVVDQGCGGITMDMFRVDNSGTPGVVYYKTHTESGTTDQICLDVELLPTTTCDDE